MMNPSTGRDGSDAVRAFRNFQLKWLELRFESAATRFRASLAGKSGFDPNEPRVPAGNPDGGQWTDGGGGGGGGGGWRGADSMVGDGITINDPPIQEVFPEYYLIPFLRSRRLLGAFNRFLASRRGNADWTYARFKTPKRWANQMEKRNWTPQEITRTIRTGKKFPAPNKVNPGNQAIRYENQETGKFVVRDEVTNEILQISGSEFIPNK